MINLSLSNNQAVIVAAWCLKAEKEAAAILNGQMTASEEQAARRRASDIAAIWKALARAAREAQG